MFKYSFKCGTCLLDTSWFWAVVIAMQCRSLCQRTLPPEESVCFPTRRFWYDTTTQLVWWDQELLLQHLREKVEQNGKYRKRHLWLDSFDKCVSETLHLPANPTFPIRSRNDAPSSAPPLRNDRDHWDIQFIVTIHNTMSVFLHHGPLARHTTQFSKLS